MAIEDQVLQSILTWQGPLSGITMAAAVTETAQTEVTGKKTSLDPFTQCCTGKINPHRVKP